MNARARKPLEPAAAQDDAGRALASEVDALLAEGPTAAAVAYVATPPQQFAAVCAMIFCARVAA